MTRAEVATALARLLEAGGFEAAITTPVFDDVEDTNWAARSVGIVHAAGLMVGDEQEKFRADSPITRAEFAVIASKWMKQPVMKSPSSFTDATTHWAADWIETAAVKGWMEGYENHTFRPDRGLTRAEFVVVMNRLLSRDPVIGIEHQTWSDVNPTHWAFGAVEAASRPK